MHKGQQFLEDDSGATAIEYCLISAAIAIAIVVALDALGVDLVAKFGEISAGLT